MGHDVPLGLTVDAVSQQAGSTAGKKGEDVKGAMLKPSSVNSPWVRAPHSKHSRAVPTPLLVYVQHGGY